MEDKKILDVADLAKLRLSRNDSCPCGSKRKVKHCCRFMLQVRHEILQREFHISAGLAANNRAADAGKVGYQRLSRSRFIEKLEEENAVNPNNGDKND